MAGPPSIAKIASMAASAAIQAVGVISQGRAANKAANFEASQLQQQAERDRRLTAQQASNLRDAEARRQATLRARVAGSGTSLEGSPLAILGDLVGEAEFQALRTTVSGETAANRAEGKAALRQFEGRNAQRAGFIKAGSTLLSSASKSLDSI